MPLRSLGGREVEAALALAIYFVGTLTASVATAAVPAAPTASPLVAMIETQAFAGSMGGLVAALVHVAAIVLAPTPATGRAARVAVIEGVFSIVVGGIVGQYLTDQVAHFLPRLDQGDRQGIAFAVGVLAWRAAPIVIRFATDPDLVRRTLVGWLGGRSKGAAE